MHAAAEVLRSASFTFHHLPFPISPFRIKQRRAPALYTLLPDLPAPCTSPYASQSRNPLASSKFPTVTDAQRYIFRVKIFNQGDDIFAGSTGHLLKLGCGDLPMGFQVINQSVL